MGAESLILKELHHFTLSKDRPPSAAVLGKSKERKYRLCFFGSSVARSTLLDQVIGESTRHVVYTSKSPE
jgi:hypothetical protein